MEELKVCWKNIGLDSNLVSELFYQIYYMGVYRAPGEDEIKPELQPPIELPDYYIGLVGGTRESIYTKPQEEIILNATPYNDSLTYTHTYTPGDSGKSIIYVILKPGVSIESGTLESGELITEYTEDDFTDSVYFDIQFGDFKVDPEVYKMIGLRGVSLCDPENTITLRLTKRAS